VPRIARPCNSIQPRPLATTLRVGGKTTRFSTRAGQLLAIDGKRM